MLTIQSKTISFPVYILFLYQEEANHSTKVLLTCGHQNLLPSHLSLLVLENPVGYGTCAIKSLGVNIYSWEHHKA